MMAVSHRGISHIKQNSRQHSNLFVLGHGTILTLWQLMRQTEHHPLGTCCFQMSTGWFGTWPTIASSAMQLCLMLLIP